MKNTKWTQQVEMEPPELPDWFWERAGVTPVEGTVDDAVGDEVLLLINDPTEGAAELNAMEPFRLFVSSGSVETPHGALGFVLFFVPNLDDPYHPYAVWEILFDPKDEEMMGPFQSLAQQSHWHIVLFGPGPEVLNAYELTNNYFLAEGLQEIVEQTEGKPCTDYEKAIAAAHEKFTLEALYEASALEPV
ncbi:MAG: hypothetical protein QF464_03960 [Myxococcota bacterium]|jgi:hypothetical protein|nr:hypothetical protein [Myxococcota bacterium]